MTIAPVLGAIGLLGGLVRPAGHAYNRTPFLKKLDQFLIDSSRFCCAGCNSGHAGICLCIECEVCTNQ